MMAIFNPEFVFGDAEPVMPRFDKRPTLPEKMEIQTISNVDEMIDKLREEILESNPDDEKFFAIKTVPMNDNLRINERSKKAAEKNAAKEEAPAMEEDDRYQFAATVTHFKDVNSFIDLRLSRPLLKALAEAGLEKPTPIQCSTIPIAMLGRDVCACARTGSGKTLAFLLPILERMVNAALLRISGGGGQTKALIVSPTRELAIQIFNVAEQMLKFCPKIQVQLAAGGLDLKTQEASLRKCPDLVVATPGRLIDHISNAPNFSLANIEYLVLDEADKLLDEYFAEQLNEIIRNCGKNRQTLLFSATMTESVKELASLSLQSPVRVFLNQATALATEIHHEFIRIRPQRENDREAIVSALVMRNFPIRTIVFLKTKKQCHRMHIILGLFGVKCGELHGDMTQDQRLLTMDRFAKPHETQRIEVLLATDLAARGLDIPDIQTVINFSLPPTMKHYVHRVGRTARAGASGRAVSLAGEPDRKILKEIVRETKYPVKSRTIPADVVQKFNEKIKKMEPAIQKILESETTEREIRLANKHMKMAQSVLEGVPVADAEERKNWFDEQREKKKQDEKAKRLGRKRQNNNKFNQRNVKNTKSSL